MRSTTATAASSNRTIEVTITGTNDAPMIAAIAQKNLTEQADTAPLTATIPVTFTDVDLIDVGHVANITGAVASGTTTGLALGEAALIAMVTPGTATKNAGSSSGSVVLSFSAASTVFDYLAKDEVLTLTYTVAIDDGDGGVTSKTFVITVTGTNDNPVVATADVTSAVTEQVTPVGNLTDSGTIALADVDLTDTHQIGPAIMASAGALGADRLREPGHGRRHWRNHQLELRRRGFRCRNISRRTRPRSSTSRLRSTTTMAASSTVRLRSSSPAPTTRRC